MPITSPELTLLQIEEGMTDQFIDNINLAFVSIDGLIPELNQMVVDMNSLHGQVVIARDAAQGAAGTAAVDAANAVALQLSDDVTASTQARNTAKGFRDESENFKNQAALLAAGNVFDDLTVSATLGWTAEKIVGHVTQELAKIDAKDEFLASGAINAKTPVALLSDGKVASIGMTEIGQGSFGTFETSGFGGATVMDVDRSSGMVLAAWGNGPNWKAVVGVITTTGAAWGPVTAVNVNKSTHHDAALSDKHVVFIDSSNSGAPNYQNYVYAQVQSLSGAAIQSGSSISIIGYSGSCGGVTYEPSSDSFVQVYGNGSNLHAVAKGYVAGSTTQSGAGPAMNLGAIYPSRVDVFPAGDSKVGVVITEGSNSKFILLDVNASRGITPSSLYSLQSGYSTTNYSRGCFIPALNAVAVVGLSGQVYLGYISGNAINFTGPFYCGFTSSQSMEIVYSSTSGKLLVIGMDSSNNNYQTGVYGTINGSAVGFGSKFVVRSSSGQNTHSLAADFTANFGSGVALTLAGETSNAVVYGSVEIPSSNNGKFIGFSEAAAVDGEEVLIARAGSIVEGLSGLTPGNTCYIGDYGSLTTTDTGAVAGRALSTSKLLISGGDR